MKTIKTIGIVAGTAILTTVADIAIYKILTRRQKKLDDKEIKDIEGKIQKGLTGIDEAQEELEELFDSLDKKLKDTSTVEAEVVEEDNTLDQKLEEIELEKRANRAKHEAKMKIMQEGHDELMTEIDKHYEKKIAVLDEIKRAYDSI